MRRVVVALVLVALMATSAFARAPAQEKKESKSSLSCSGLGGFAVCYTLTNFANCVLLPWTDCGKRLRDNAAKLLRCTQEQDRWRAEWRRQQALGVQGPPYVPPCQ